MNKYFIIKLPDSALENILKHCVGTATSQRRSVDGKSVVVKLPVGSEIPGIMNHLTPYTHSEILIEMAKPEWQHENI